MTIFGGWGVCDGGVEVILQRKMVVCDGNGWKKGKVGLGRFEFVFDGIRHFVQS